VNAFVATWLAADVIVVAAIVAMRRRDIVRLRLGWVAQGLALLSAGAATVVPELTTIAFWLLVACMNASFAFWSEALGGRRVLARVGAASTLAAVALLLLRSMLSLILAAVATVLCAGGVLVAIWHRRSGVTSVPHSSALGYD